MSGTRFGNRVRVKCGATGRYVGLGCALVVSVGNNDLFLDAVNPAGEPPHPSLPVPTDQEIAGAAAALRTWSRPPSPEGAGP